MTGLSLPRDFWTQPDAFGMSDLVIGCVIGFSLGWRYLPNAARIYSWQSSLEKTIWLVFTMFFGFAGMFLGEVVRTYWLGYL